MAFDTYRAVKDLEEVGFDESAAHAMVSVVGRAIGEGMVTKSDIKDMATRSDLAELRSEMATKSDLLELRSEMATKSDLLELRSEMATKSDLLELRSETATKSDLLELRSETATKSDVAQIRSDSRADINDSEARLTTRLMWIGLGIVGLTSAIMGALDQILG